jgi:hypothetical protein
MKQFNLFLTLRFPLCYRYRLATILFVLMAFSAVQAQTLAEMLGTTVSDLPPARATASSSLGSGIMLNVRSGRKTRATIALIVVATLAPRARAF